MFQLTPGAVKAAKRFIRYSEEPVLGLRVGINSGGCSGFRYEVELCKALVDGDELITIDGVKIYTDPVSIPYIKGMTIDFKETMMESKFVFDNPNASSSCGCGNSFEIHQIAEVE
ncbi:iron-sulfur cluster assembly accessory protein [Magnetococcus marinus MC-1]|uniref:Iron-sulfur cluster assembly accessory protein n=1 Tax=Magnetococcus marinus (strain ATCC BAA-1437 / JCM 17883 / MC-1) TaxID=156889 RepID=A0LD00_MAGMM|nr:iron-sulfur cluster assembly accessory protein [Magnetococcus marinus]ABK45843.1 iron-sulfur cluster assembly accessory protein [Magnetococcus marinus MC-1]